MADTDFAKESLETEKSYLDRYKMVPNETSIISNFLEVSQEVNKEEVTSVAPEERKEPIS